MIESKPTYEELETRIKNLELQLNHSNDLTNNSEMSELQFRDLFEHMREGFAYCKITYLYTKWAI